MTAPQREHAGHLDLGFTRAGGRTTLNRRDYSWPYTVGRGFYLDDRADAVTVIIQSVSGSITSGDRLTQRIHAGAHTRVRLRAQGAVSVHRSDPGQWSAESISLSVEPGGYLEQLSECRILFPESALLQSIRIDVAEGAAAIVVDAFLVLFSESGDAFRRYSSHISVVCGGEVRATEVVDLHRWPRHSGELDRYVAHALVVLAAPGRDWSEAFPSGAADETVIPGVYSAISALPNRAGLAARIAAVDGRVLRLAIDACLERFRQAERYAG